jgi:transcriptional regulator with XRE-family HTH domain
MTHTVRDYVAGVLRAETARQRLAQKEVARRCGRSDAWVSDRFTAKTACDVDDLALLAEVLGMNIRDMLPADTRSAA